MRCPEPYYGREGRIHYCEKSAGHEDLCYTEVTW